MAHITLRKTIISVVMSISILTETSQVAPGISVSYAGNMSLSPNIRTDTPIAVVTDRGTRLEVDGTPEMTDAARQVFREKWGGESVESRIARVLEKHGVRRPPYILKGMINRAFPGEHRFGYNIDGLRKEGKTVLIPYDGEDGAGCLLRYYLAEDDPVEARGKISRKAGSSDRVRVITEPKLAPRPARVARTRATGSTERATERVSIYDVVHGPRGEGGVYVQPSLADLPEMLYLFAYMSLKTFSTGVRIMRPVSGMSRINVVDMGEAPTSVEATGYALDAGTYEKLASNIRHRLAGRSRGVIRGEYNIVLYLEIADDGTISILGTDKFDNRKIEELGREAADIPDEVSSTDSGNVAASIIDIISKHTREIYAELERYGFTETNGQRCVAASKLMALALSNVSGLPIGGEKGARIEVVPGAFYAPGRIITHHWVAVYDGTGQHPALLVDASYGQFDLAYEGRVVCGDHDEMMRTLSLRDGRDLFRDAVRIHFKTAPEEVTPERLRERVHELRELEESNGTEHPFLVAYRTYLHNEHIREGRLVNLGPEYEDRIKTALPAVITALSPPVEEARSSEDTRLAVTGSQEVVIEFFDTASSAFMRMEFPGLLRALATKDSVAGLLAPLFAARKPGMGYYEYALVHDLMETAEDTPLTYSERKGLFREMAGCRWTSFTQSFRRHIATNGIFSLELKIPGEAGHQRQNIQYANFDIARDLWRSYGERSGVERVVCVVDLPPGTYRNYAWEGDIEYTADKPFRMIVYEYHDGVRLDNVGPEHLKYYAGRMGMAPAAFTERMVRQVFEICENMHDSGYYGLRKADDGKLHTEMHIGNFKLCADGNIRHVSDFGEIRRGKKAFSTRERIVDLDKIIRGCALVFGQDERDAGRDTARLPRRRIYEIAIDEVRRRTGEPVQDRVSAAADKSAEAVTDEPDADTERVRGMMMRVFAAAEDAYARTEKGENIVIGIDTSWIPPAELASMGKLTNQSWWEGVWRKKGLTNVVTVVDKGPALAGTLIERNRKDRARNPLRNMIVVGDGRVLRAGEFTPLREQKDAPGAFFAELEVPEKIPPAYCMDIDIVKVIDEAVKEAFGGENPGFRKFPVELVPIDRDMIEKMSRRYDRYEREIEIKA